MVTPGIGYGRVCSEKLDEKLRDARYRTARSKYGSIAIAAALNDGSAHPCIGVRSNRGTHIVVALNPNRNRVTPSLLAKFIADIARSNRFARYNRKMQHRCG
jgi:hypothetical protein